MADMPAKYPEWATDTRYDPITGFLNRLEPLEQFKDSGLVEGEFYPAEFHNHESGLTNEWVEHLDQRYSDSDIFITTDSTETEATISQRLGGNWYVFGVGGSLDTVNIYAFSKTTAYRFIPLFGGTDYATQTTYTTVSGDEIHDTFEITSDIACYPADYMSRAVGGALTVSSGSVSPTTAPVDGNYYTYVWSGMTAGTNVSVIMADATNSNNAVGNWVERKIYSGGSLIHHIFNDLTTGNLYDVITQTSYGTITGLVPGDYTYSKLVAGQWVAV